MFRIASLVFGCLLLFVFFLTYFKKISLDDSHKKYFFLLTVFQFFAVLGKLDFMAGISIFLTTAFFGYYLNIFINQIRSSSRQDCDH
jgi:hypothetical protein